MLAQFPHKHRQAIPSNTRQRIYQSISNHEINSPYDAEQDIELYL